MGNVWTVARQTLSEAMRMKVAMLCIALLAAIVIGLPFVSRGDGSLTGAVQSFLQYSMVAVSFLLACVTVFLSKSLSDDLVGKQILMVMTKPIARWQYVLGKWLGIVLLDVIVLGLSGAAIYGMTMYLAGRTRGFIVMSVLLAVLAIWAAYRLFHGLRPVRPTRAKWAGLSVALVAVVAVGGAGVYELHRRQQTFIPRDEYDAERLDNQVLQARHSQRFVLPTEMFAARVQEQYEQNLLQGKYAGVLTFNEGMEKGRLRTEIEQDWRLVAPLEVRQFQFRDVRCSRSPDELIHLKYEYRTFKYPPDEIVRIAWFAGDPNKDTARYVIPRRDVLDRRHTVAIPGDAVAPDGTLLITLQNANPFVGQPGEQQYDTALRFEGADAVEILFSVGTFGWNLVRALTLVLCRLAFLAALAVTAATVFSFPVACLVSLTIYTLATTRGFLGESIDWIGNESIGQQAAHGVLSTLVYLVYLVVPNFAEFDGLGTLVDGRNVTLMWVMLGIGKLGILHTGILLLLGCLMFHRRQMAEISV